MLTSEDIDYFADIISGCVNFVVMEISSDQPRKSLGYKVEHENRYSMTLSYLAKSTLSHVSSSIYDIIDFYRVV